MYTMSFSADMTGEGLEVGFGETAGEGVRHLYTPIPVIAMMTKAATMIRSMRGLADFPTTPLLATAPRSGCEEAVVAYSSAFWTPTPRFAPSGLSLCFGLFAPETSRAFAPGGNDSGRVSIRVST